MALILPNQLLVLNAYALLVDETPGNTAYAEHQAFIAANGTNGTSAYSSALDSIFTATSNASLASTMLANLGLGAIFTQAQGEAYLAANSSNRVGAMLDLANMLVNYSGADAAVVAAKSAYVSTLNDSYAYSSDTANKSGASLDDDGAVTNTFELTAGTDRATGTSAADFFEAFISQNSTAGGVSNTLSSADRIAGGGGADSLYAELVPEFFGNTGDNQVDVQPRISGVETIEFEARDAGGSAQYLGWDSNLVTVDAKNITGVDSIGSAFSDGDLIIENLTTLTDDGVARNTSAITVTMDHTENFDSGEDASDLAVLFDEDYLLAGEINSSTLELRLVNAFELATDNTPLVAFTAVSFSVGATLVVVPITAEMTALEGSAAYAALVTAIQTQLATQGITGVSVTAQPVRDVLFSDNVGTFVQGEVAGNYTPILLTSSGATLTRGQAQLDNTTLDFNGLNTQVNTLETGGIPITVNVELNKVGRDGEGGDLVIGGKDQNWELDSDDDQADGIEVFNISVLGDDQLPSNLGYISSTNQALTTVNIATADSTLASFASLTIRDAFNGVGDPDSDGHNYDDSNFTNVETVNANAFLGDLIVGIGRNALNIDTFTATGGGDVTLVEEINGDERSNFSVTTGAGDDSIFIALGGDAVDSLNTGLAITTAGGDDYVEVTGEDGVSDETTLELENLTISTGAGADEIDIFAEHIYRVNAGSESDFVRVDAQPNNNNTFGSWSIGDGTGAAGDDWADRVLYQATLTVDFAGFSQTVTVNTTAAGFFIATQLDINNAVIAAIDANSELSRLLDTSKGSGSEGNQLLTITSNVEGLNDLTIQVVQPVVVASGAGAGQVNFTASHLGAIQIGLVRTTLLDSAQTDTVAEIVAAMADIDGNLDETGAPLVDDFVLDSADGNDGNNNTGATSHAIVNMSTGANDLIALDSDLDSADTLVFSAVWGKVSVLNFFEEQFNDAAQGAAVPNTTVITHNDETVGDHILDFTAWLDDMTTTSTSVLSALRVDTTVQTDGASAMAVLSNQVTIVDDFDSTVGDTGETWANLTAAHLQNSLNGVSVGTVGTGFGNFTEASATAPALLLGTTIDTIIMVENDGNDGEYKVYNAEVSDLGGATNTDTFTVTYLGIIDFGETINVGVIGVTDQNFAGAAILAP